MMQKNKEEKSTIKQVSKWSVLAILCFTQITNISLFTGVGPIWSNLATYYETDSYNFNWFTNWYYFGPMVFSFLFNPLIIYNYGVSQILSCLFTAVAYWILYFGKDSYLCGMFGFVLLGLGNSLFYQVPLQLSKLWFQPEERILTTSVGQYANNIGMLGGYLAASIYFYEIVDQDEIIQQYLNFIFIEAVLSTICLGVSFLTLRNPVYNNEAIQRFNMVINIQDIQSQGKFYGFNFLLIMYLHEYIVVFGLSWCYTMLFGYQQYLIGQTTLQITITNVLYQIGAIISALICTIFLDKQSQRGSQQDYDKYIKYTIHIGYFALVIELLFMESLPFSLTAIVNFFIGAGLGGTYSILLESLMEKHYPVQELAIASLLSGIACSISFVITMILAIPQFLQYGFQISCYFLIPPYCYIVVFYETNYKRFEFES